MIGFVSLNIHLIQSFEDSHEFILKNILSKIHINYVVGLMY